LLAQIGCSKARELRTMTIRMDKALRRRLAGSALGLLIAFAAVPGAMAQWLPPWRIVMPAGAIAGRLEAQGYILIAPLQRRPGVYLADVRAGATGYQRLVIDDRSGEILERFISPPRGVRPEFVGRYDGFNPSPPPGVVHPPGYGFDGPNGGTAPRSAYGGPTDVHIPSAISPYGPQSSPLSTKPKAPAATVRKTPLANSAPAAAPPTVGPPLPPPAPREAAKPEESAPPAPKPEPKIESAPGETENASTGSAFPAAPEANREPARIEPQAQAPTHPADSAPEPTAKPIAPASSAEASDKPKTSIVPPALFE
jgi:hypothetical protein